LTFIWFVRDLPRFSSSQTEQEQLFWHCANSHWGPVPMFFAQQFGFQQRGEAVPLEEIIARAAVKALAMEVSRGLPGRDAKGIAKPRSLIPLLHRRGDVFVAGFTTDQQAFGPAAPWV